jgi:hypothetical protein
MLRWLNRVGISRIRIILHIGPINDSAFKAENVCVWIDGNERKQFVDVLVVKSHIVI